VSLQKNRVLARSIRLHLFRLLGLQDGILSYQKSQFGYILEGLGMENFGIFYCRWINFMGIWYLFGSFGIFTTISICCTKKKSGNLVVYSFYQLIATTIFYDM
jgi:hypothetical protein